MSLSQDLTEESFGVTDKQSVRLLKQVVIAKSGIYKYLPRELRGLGIHNTPEQHMKRRFLSVYRPPEVIDSAKELFARQPVTVDHPPVFVSDTNFREYVTGWVGDSSTIESSNDAGAVKIKATLTLVDKQAIDAYNNEVREVSPGYIGTFIWEDGTDGNGEEYQIKMTEITEVNHLAIVKRGRGGSDVSILDNRSVFMDEEEKKSLFDGFSKIMTEMFKGKQVVDAKPVEVTLDSLPKDPKDFTPDHVSFLLGMVRDSAMEASKEPVLEKEEEVVGEKKEEEATTEKKANEELKEKASVEGETGKPEVKDSKSVFNAGVSNETNSGFDIFKFDASISGKTQGRVK